MSVTHRPSNAPAAWTNRAVLADSSWEAALWSRRGQEARFDAVVRHLDLQPGDSLLDFGCGTGRFVDWLPAGVSYLGYDTSRGMVERARREYPGWEFTTEFPDRSFTHVCAIGIWNLASWEDAKRDIDRLLLVAGRKLVASVHRNLASPDEIEEQYGVTPFTDHLPNDSILVREWYG
jgi:ubiquinone/menaquinone biosynthesis C-methylase UbiE